MRGPAVPNAAPLASTGPQALPADVGKVISFEVRVQALYVRCWTVCGHVSKGFSLTS